jgi:hypothetical protein
MGVVLQLFQEDMLSGLARTLFMMACCGQQSGLIIWAWQENFFGRRYAIDGIAFRGTSVKYGDGCPGWTAIYYQGNQAFRTSSPGRR